MTNGEMKQKVILTVLGAVTSVALAAGGWIFRGFDERLRELETVVPPVATETAVSKAEIGSIKQSLERLEDKIDWLIRTENEAHRQSLRQP